MKPIKKHYSVYSRYYRNEEDTENCYTGEWVFVGETYAVSEIKAINNVRYRTMGNVSQYKPIAVSGHWDNGLEWKAVCDEKNQKNDAKENRDRDEQYKVWVRVPTMEVARIIIDQIIMYFGEGETEYIIYIPECNKVRPIRRKSKTFDDILWLSMMVGNDNIVERKADETTGRNQEGQQIAVYRKSEKQNR